MTTRTSPSTSDLFAFDLCVLAYQIYNQSLLWPLDPFFEAWSRPGASRRDNVMAQVHQDVAGRDALRGPGSTRGWASNTQLDPIITDYSRLNPRRGVVTGDGSGYRVMRSGEWIANRIGETAVCEYSAHRNGNPAEPTMVHRTTIDDEGVDKLYAFEGGTGSHDAKPHAWGLLGIVLERTTGDDYEVHIGFRGSQSGDAYRAAYQGFVREVGNPDWVTDMEFLQTVHDPRISPVGEVSLGLRDSVSSSFATIEHVLVDIAQRRGQAPKSVHLAGHSLGGALAVQLASALTSGRLRSELHNDLAAWPLDALQLTTFGAPKSGDADFAAGFPSTIGARRIWIHGDPIPEFPAHEHVGVPVRLENGQVGPDNHEPQVTRRVLVDELRWQGEGSDAVMADYEPWQDFDDLGTALYGAASLGDDMVGLFATNPEAEAMLINASATAVGQASSYRWPWSKPGPERRRRSARLRALFGQPSGSLDDLVNHLGRIRGVQPGTTEDHLRQWYVVSEASNNGWTIADLLDDAVIAKVLGTFRRPIDAGDTSREVSLAVGPEPTTRDTMRVKGILAMRRFHRATVDGGDQDGYRRRVPPASAMPKLIRACSNYPGLEWLPRQLMVPEKMPAEGQIPPIYKAKYYGSGKLGFAAYEQSPINPDVPWRPEYPWNHAFDPPEDGWAKPTDDDTFVRLRLHGPNPFSLERVGDEFVLDFSKLFADVLPPIIARFDNIDGTLTPREISIGRYVHRPADPTWDRAKRVVNAADIRVAVFVRHLVDVHLITGQAFALSAYNLPTWHRLRPFLHFFSYGTMQVNDFAYQAFFSPSSYFIASGFVTKEATEAMFHARVADFDLDMWNPVKDIARRGIDEIADHPYVDDARRAWPEFVGMVETFLDSIGLDDQAVRDDDQLDIWYRTLATLIPGLDARSKPLDRVALVELLSCFLYNNVVHEVCGDLSPILRSEDPDDRAIINLDRLANAIGDGRLDRSIPAPTMGDVFLMDQASDASRFNVGGNNLLEITPERWVDDPQLWAALRDLQDRLRSLDAEFDRRNDDREVRFGRMQPRHWEASISF